MITSRKLSDLDPVVQPICQAHIDECDGIGVELLITATWRDAEAQDALYQQGRTPGDIRKIVTNAKGWASWHQYKAAYDVVPIIGGKCVWDDKVLWDHIIAAGIRAGAEAGALWANFRDVPHFQYIPKGLSLKDAEARFKTHGSIF